VAWGALVEAVVAVEEVEPALAWAVLARSCGVASLRGFDAIPGFSWLVDLDVLVATLSALPSR